MDWLDLLAVQGTLNDLQYYSSKASILWVLSFLYSPTLTSIHDYWKNHSFDYIDLCQQSHVCLCFLIVITLCCLHFPGDSDGKVSAYNARDLGSIPGLGRSPGEGNGNPLQYSCLENPMDRGAW